MARLNEAPVPTESVDALKRRFIRQNRELAKNNSNQSIRIRNLEVEQSRLAAENLSLRERIIELETQVERVQNESAAHNTNLVKDKLQAKIQELGNLVAELGLAPKALESPKGNTTTPGLSPALLNWRNARLIDPMVEDARLPTIAEGKHFPRKTLDAEDIHRVSLDPAVESPDLGPPPVAHFPDEDPIKFDPKSSHAADVGAGDENDDLSAPLSVDLGTRRRRRESQTKPEIRRMSIFQSPPEKGDSEESTYEQPVLVKAGAKRKLGVRDDEDEHNKTKPTEAVDVFRFSRKNIQQLQDAETKATLSGKRDKTENHSDTITKRALAISERRVLGVKSINTDPVVSPQKSKPTAGSKPDPKKPGLPINESNRPRARERKQKSSSITPDPLPVVIPRPPVEVVEIVELPPKTPAGLDLFSPPSTNPSAARPESKDTPPPGEISRSSAFSTSEAMNQPGGGRIGRRARANINYAEPNLVSKMRRPGKELAPAVVERSKSSSAEPSTAEKAQMQMGIKGEPGEGCDATWKDLPSIVGDKTHSEEPNSPLSKKNGAHSLPSATELREEASSSQDPRTSASAAAMADLLAEATSRKRGSRFPSTGMSTTQLKESTTEKTIKTEDRSVKLVTFDSTLSSSPTDSSASLHHSDVGRSDTSKLKSSRRHSSMSNLNTAPAGYRATDVSNSRPSREPKSVTILQGGDKATESASVRGDRITSRRKSMMI